LTTLAALLCRELKLDLDASISIYGLESDFYGSSFLLAVDFTKLISFFGGERLVYFAGDFNSSFFSFFALPFAFDYPLEIDGVIPPCIGAIIGDFIYPKNSFFFLSTSTNFSNSSLFSSIIAFSFSSRSLMSFPSSSIWRASA